LNQLIPAFEAAALPGADLPKMADTRGDVRLGLAIAGLFFILFLGWAAFARLDSAAIAGGQLIVSGQRQTVQHRDGGLVTAILVKEGQKVRKGQLLIRLAGAEVEAQERALSAQAIVLIAQRARLEAEQSGSSTIVPPPEFANLHEDDRAAAAAAMRIQQVQLRSRMAVLAAERGALGERTASANSQGQGYNRQVAAIDDQLRSIDEELSALTPIAEKGFVSKTRLRALERAKADLEGQRGQYLATVAQSRNQASESRLQVLETQGTYLSRSAGELRDVVASLNDVLPKLRAAREQLARTEIRSPATGTVVGLTVFTPGGVIAAGEKLMDVVPDRMPLAIEARISPNDADDIQVGQLAFVRFDALHERTLPPLEGHVTRLSADVFTDEKTGTSFYTAEISIPHEALTAIRDVRGAKFEFRSGMPVSVQMPLRRRTALQYALEPLTAATRDSFSEH
jgi:HlyD family secretion protein